MDRATLYQALASRGGFCDCEVLNAAREDDELLRSVLVAGRLLEGDAGQVLDVLGDLALDFAPPPLATLGRDVMKDVRTEGGLCVADDGRIAPQLADCADVGEFFRCLLEEMPQGASLQLVLRYPDGEDVEGEVVMLGPGPGRFQTRPLQAAQLPEDSSRDRERLEKAVPVRGPVFSAGAVSLPTTPDSDSEPGPNPRLLARGERSWLVLSPDGRERTPLDLSAARMSFTPKLDHAVFLLSWRTRMDLVVEDRARASRRRLGTERFEGDPVLSPDGREAFASAASTIWAFDCGTGGRRAVCPGSAFALSPDGNLVAAVSGDELTVFDQKGRPLVPPREGRAPVWSPCGTHLAFLAKVQGEGWQAFLLELASGAVRRMSPPCEEACWPSFTDSGAHLVLYVRTARYRTPLGDGRFKVEEDESLLRIPVAEPAAAKTLWSSARGYMRIVAPLAHPVLPLVAFRTQDSPMVGRRLVLVDGDGAPRTLVQEWASPTAWLA
ncbi:MAG: hypothetical protein QM765_06065 [Myxococcales bacterium]